MSIGFRVVNDWGNLSVDENNPIFIAVDGAAGAIDNGGWTNVQLYEDFGGIGPVALFFEYTFFGTSTSPTPPLVFARPRNIAANVATVIGYCAAKGAPGAWTGVVVAFSVVNLPEGGSTKPELYNVLRKYMCEFLVVSCDGYISGETHGIRVWAPGAGSVVFDSGNNAVSYKRSDGIWNYSNREQVLSDQYVEFWFGSDVFSARNEWMLVSSIGTGYFMRYNGEVAGSRLYVPGKTGEQIGRMILTGRSGTLIHMPFLFIETRRPLEQGIILPPGNGPA
ncbi:hypothetical protein [Pseudomonas aeruginosa]|uniref:hypothetical protein n=1 Tax=Pseudomonas aeruginosa TaxID=287 RepID=UPI000FC40960|nr:hypothetical protein [Pseudomonas aeruginosa]RUI20255.1 hypothetical protein IPC443_23500 [Pseudomonas aeruginosa]HBO7073355.1 hypothetical protein [Pseudomonas aeruginosa]